LCDHLIAVLEIFDGILDGVQCAISNSAELKEVKGTKMSYIVYCFGRDGEREGEKRGYYE